MAQPASDTSWLTGLNFTITDQPAGGGASGGAAVPNSGTGSGSFSLSVDEAQSMLTTAKRVRDQLQLMHAKAEALTRLKPPADEPGSNGYNAMLVGNGQSKGAFGEGLDQVTRERDYCNELIVQLQDALKITGASDQQATSAVASAAKNQDKGFA